MARRTETVGPFRLGAVIGSGGFGTVYRAVGPDGAEVALKLLAPHVDSRETVERFHREGTIRIEHPNVVRVIDAGRDDGVSYIAFELLVGRPLSTVLESAPLPAAQVLGIAKQICAGLAAAHARGIVHRDLKPGNVFCCEDGAVKILDFGIARPMSQAGPQLTMAGSVIGTPGFLSPEQAKGDVNIAPAADLWSLGVILYQALSGQNPFMRQTAVATILAVVLEEAPPLERADGLPRGLAEIVASCLVKSPTARVSSAEELLRALEGIDLAASLVTEAPAALTATIPEDERRVVALLLASEVRDLERVRAVVEELGGELIPMLGGAIGVFGGRTYEGDEASRAVRAALEARDAVAWVAVSTGRATGRGGTVSGEAVTAVERAVAAKVAGVAVDAAAARQLRAQFELVPVGDALFEVPRALTRRETGNFPSLREDLPLLGRDAELAAMERAIESAFATPHATAIWVSGPPGIGKTRLRAELERRLAARGEVTVLSARCESHRRDAAYHAFAQLLRSEATLEPFFTNAGVSPGRRERALRELLERVLADATWARQCIEPLGRLLGLPIGLDAAGTRRSDPQLLADRLRVSLADVLSELARAPLAIVLDDAQWADAPSLALLDDLLDRLASRPLLVFVASRPELAEARPDLFAGRDLRRIEPHGLSAAEVATAAAAIAGRDVPAALTQEIAARTGGNPFFVEQIVRELVEQDLLDRELAELPIPLDVEGAVQSRLDHLPAPEKQLCKKASVFATAFSEPALEALELTEPARHLGALAKRGLVSARRGGVEGHVYRFRSSLVADVAYRMNTDEARGELHRMAAAFLERAPGVDREELARHLALGGEPERAAAAYAQAAFEASVRGDGSSVLRCADRALELGVEGETACELHLARADALSFGGDKDARRAALDAALACAVDDTQRAAALSLDGSLVASAGQTDEGLRLTTEGVAVARAVGDRETLAIALARHGWVLLYAGRVTEAAEVIGEASSLDDVSPETAALVATWRGQLYTALGDLHRRKIAMQDAIERYRAIGDLRRAAACEVNLADTFNRIGAYDEAEASLRAALESCRRVGNRVVEGYAQANLGYALAGQARLDEALAAFDAALEAARALDQPRLALAVRAYRARALLLREPPLEVAEEARRVARAARETQVPAIEASALAIASRAALAGDDADAALEDAERAMALRDEIGTMEEDEAELFLALAEALRATGHAARASEVVARGASRLEFLAGRIADVDWRARFLVEVATNRRLIELDGEGT
ncbi:MAG: protein kinase [Sandaracinaceae bacterium]|nr:protein kinase [Sandaracinaceae bacterium]